MAQQTADNQFRTVGLLAERAFLMLATICMLMMPSIYRGGSSVPHSHSFFQFLLTGADRAFDHHREDGLGAAAHDGHAGHQVDVSASHSGNAAMSAAEDQPRVSPSSAPGGTVSAVMIALGALLALALTASAKMRFPVWRSSLTGWFSSPEPPPPRLGCAV